jgi:hypothetical protein
LCRYNTEDLLLNATTVWAKPKTIYSIDEDRFIPKMLANKLVVLSTVGLDNHFSQRYFCSQNTFN